MRQLLNAFIENDVSAADITALKEAQASGRYSRDIEFEHDRDGGMAAVFRNEQLDEIRRPNLRKDIE